MEEGGKSAWKETDGGRSLFPLRFLPCEVPQHWKKDLGMDVTWRALVAEVQGVQSQDHILVKVHEGVTLVDD
jgi:hypothetical protein